MRRAFGWALALAALLTLLGLGGTAEAAFPGANGKIAFATDRDTEWEIYSMNPDGTGETRLTNDPATNTWPAWSPNGSKLAFERLEGDYQIYVMNIDDGTQTRLTNPLLGGGELPAWSPDETKIAFTTYRDDNEDFTYEIYVMNADGSGQTRLTQNFVDEYSPDWSPDGTRIYFTSWRHGDSEVYAMDADGNSEVNLTNSSTTHDGFPSTSPDGSKIAFARTPRVGGTTDIYTMNPDGTGQSNVTSTPSISEDRPSWSPDGSKIAFAVGAGSNWDIHAMNTDGSGRTQLTDWGGYDVSADWQPIPHQSSPAPSFDHPRLASPLQFSLVPVHRPTLSSSQCSARGGAPSTHGAPLSFSSCNPPAYRPGTTAHLGPQSEGTASIAAIYGDTSAANGDQANLTLRASVTDVQTQAGADYVPSPSGPDVTLVAGLRLTDTYNGPSQNGSATTINFEFEVPVNCTATTGAEGSSCNVDTSADTLAPGAIRENESMVLDVLRLRIDDSGANSVRGDLDDRIFASHGLYVP